MCPKRQLDVRTRLPLNQSANGVTLLPVWFIEAFGVLFLAGTVWLGIKQGWVWGGTTTVSVTLAMMFIRRAVRHRSRNGIGEP